MRGSWFTPVIQSSDKQEQKRWILTMSYWELQLQAVTALGMLGLPTDARNRLDLFRIRYLLTNGRLSRHEDQTLVSDTVFVLDELARLRIEGKEPPHDGKRYL